MAVLCLKRLVAPALALGLMSVAVGAQSVDVSHDGAVDFKAFKTYALGSVTVTGDADPLMVQRIVSAVDSQMSAIGLRKVEKDPDVIVATEHWRGVSYPYWWSKQYSGYDVRKVFAGRVVVELIDARTQRVVFRGTAKDRVTSTTTEGPCATLIEPSESCAFGLPHQIRVSRLSCVSSPSISLEPAIRFTHPSGCRSSS